MAITSSHPMARQLCEAVGVDPDMVHRLEIRIQAGAPVIVDVEMYPDLESVGDFARILAKRFNLVEQGGG